MSKHKAVFFLFFLLIISCHQTQSEIDLKEFDFNIPKVKIYADDPLLKIENEIYFYKGELYSGMIETSQASPTKRIYSISNGLQHGKQIGWHTNDHLSFKYYCINGRRHGKYLEYYPIGKLQIQAEYKLGEELSRTIWDLNGRTIVNYVIKDGRFYGLLGSSDCLSVFNADKTKASLKE